MKILHTSDIHLDSPLTTRLDSDKVKARRAELLATFRSCAAYASREGAEAFIISGDLFDSESVSRTTLEYIVSTVELYPSITFFYLFGNHEKKVIVESGIRIPRNLKIFDDEWTYYRLDDTVIAGRCTTAKDMFDTLTLDAAKRNVVVLHGTLTDRSDEGGMIGTKDLADMPIDYLALGHYHTYTATAIGDRCTAVYPGTPEGRGFDESGRKGCVLVEIDRYGTSHRFIGTAKRTLFIEEVDVSGLFRGIEVENAIENATRGATKDDMVRIILTGERDVRDRYDVEAIKESFRSRFYYFEIKDAARARISSEEFKLDRSLKGEFIRSVLDDATLDGQTKEEVIATGLRALLGESID